MEDIKYIPISITELNERINDIISNETLLQDVFVEGEIGSCNYHSSGHVYLTLKDEKSQIRCNVWKWTVCSLKFKLKQGMRICVNGSVDFYNARGEISINAKKIIPMGVGDLHLKYEQLKAKLLAEGLFDENRKKPLPLFPKKIAMITSPTGAVIKDMVDNARLRMPCVDLLLIPAICQGEQARASLIGAMKVADSLDDVDVVILARGGGSFEDLFCYNDEGVVRQVASMKKPIITGIGHEPDYTLVDFAADMRASTPTKTIQVALRDKKEIERYLFNTENEIYNTVWKNFKNKKELFTTLSSNPYLKDPFKIINDKIKDLDILSENLTNSYKNILEKKNNEFKNSLTKLHELSPLKILSQGYSLTEKENKVLLSVNELKKGDEINTYINDGEIKSIVAEIKRK